jgi:hypothetical protein
MFLNILWKKDIEDIEEASFKRRALKKSPQYLRLKKGSKKFNLTL